MKILNFGSLNVDYVYEVEHFVQPGETLSSEKLFINCGGKGLNQSIAAAKAGNEVVHAGWVGVGGQMLEDKLAESNVDVSSMKQHEGQTGHAIIQVDKNGQNCILLYGGTNQLLTREYIDDAFAKFGNEGIVLLQNETNLIDYIMKQAYDRGLQIALNAAPMSDKVLKYPLGLLDWLIVNEVEGKQIAECETDEEILPRLKRKLPNANLLLTLGSRGAICYSKNKTYQIGTFPVDVVDTTAAGDTFTGYFLYGVLNAKSVEEALLLATTASTIAIGIKGASDSIPMLADVEQAMKDKTFGTLDITKR